MPVMYLKPIRVPKVGIASSRFRGGKQQPLKESLVCLIFSYTRSTLISRVVITQLSGMISSRTLATRLRAHGVHEYGIQDLLGHSKPGVTKVYARARRNQSWKQQLRD